MPLGYVRTCCVKYNGQIVCSNVVYLGITLVADVQILALILCTQLGPRGGENIVGTDNRIRTDSGRVWSSGQRAFAYGAATEGHGTGKQVFVFAKAKTKNRIARLESFTNFCNIMIMLSCQFFSENNQ